MKRLTVTRLFATGILLVAIAIGCSSGKGPLSPEPSRQNSMFLSLGNVEQNGNEITIEVNYSRAVELRALSFRLGYDPQGLKPVDIQWNDLSPDDSTFQILNRDGFLPLAIAAFGRPIGIDGNGTLCTIKFQVLDPSRGGVHIIDDPAFLVAKDLTGTSIDMSVGGGSR
jgi:hypothetical protein